MTRAFHTLSISNSLRAVVKTMVDKPSVYTIPELGRGGYFLVKDYWGCAAGWGRIFTTRLTIMGYNFSRVTRMGSQIFGLFGIRKFW